MRASADKPSAPAAGDAAGDLPEADIAAAEASPVRSLTVLSGIVAVQSVGLLVYGVYLLVQGVIGHPVSVAQAESVGGIVVFFALGLLLVPYGLIRARSWSRTPTVLLEVLSFVLVYDLWLAHVYWLAVVAGVVAASALYLVLQPAVTRTLYDASSRRPAVPVAATTTVIPTAGSPAKEDRAANSSASSAKAVSGKRR